MNKLNTGHFILFLLMCGFCVSLTAGEPRLKVEGVVSGLSSKGEGLSALIDGEIYSPGETVGDYTVEEIRAHEVILRPLDGAERLTIAVGGARRVEEAVPEEAVVEDSKSWLGQTVERHFPVLSQLGEKFRYSGIVRDLKKVHMSAMIYVLERGVSDVSVSQLVAKGSLPAFMKNPRDDGYHFRIMAVRDGVRVYAEPDLDASGKKHFLMDEHGYIYVEAGRRATPESSRFDHHYVISLE